MSFTEANYENAILELFRDTLGYNHIYAPDLTRDYSEPFFMDELLLALHKINPTLPEAAIVEAVYKLRNFEGGSFQQKNVQFMKYLQNGVTVDFHDGVEKRSHLVYLVDYQNVDNNAFTVANQWTITENSENVRMLLCF